MGQAKNRGTFQERKEKAEKIKQAKEEVKAEMRKELESKSTDELMQIAGKVGVVSLSPAHKMAITAALNRALLNEQ